MDKASVERGPRWRLRSARAKAVRGNTDMSRARNALEVEATVNRSLRESSTQPLRTRAYPAVWRRATPMTDRANAVIHGIARDSRAWKAPPWRAMRANAA